MDYRIRQDIERKLQGEKGTIFKAAQGKIRIALIYPNTYYVGMSNLGLQTIYGFLNAREDVCCERAFLPEAHSRSVHTDAHTVVFPGIPNSAVGV